MAEPLYTCRRQEAIRYGELDKWKQSHRANIRCAHDIDKLITSHSKNGQLEPGGLSWRAG